MVLVPITPEVSVEKGSCRTQTGWKGEGSWLSPVPKPSLSFNRGDQTPATPHAPRLQISLIRWEGEPFPCNFSL